MIQDYDNTDYIASSCLIKDLRVDGGDAGQITVLTGDKWEIEHQYKTASAIYGDWRIGTLQTCYINQNDKIFGYNGEKDIDDGSEWPKWDPVTFLYPDALLTLYYLIVVLSAIFVACPCCCLGTFQVCNAENSDDDDHEVEMSVLMMLVCWSCIVFTFLIGLFAFALVLMEAETLSAGDIYNVHNYESIFADADANDGYPYNDEYFICEISDVIDSQFSQRKVGFDGGKIKKRTFFWGLYKVNVLKLNSSDPSFEDDIDMFNSNNDFYNDSLSLVENIKSATLISNDSYAMESFTVGTKKYRKAGVSHYSEYWDIAEIGDSDWCYKTKKLDHQYQYNEPSNKLIHSTNHLYGLNLIWTFVFTFLCCFCQDRGYRSYKDRD